MRQKTAGEEMTICDKLARHREDLRFLTELTAATDREQGANVCLINNDIILSTKTGGEAEEIMTLPCPENTKTVGFFHTHPQSGVAVPSEGDFAYAKERDYTVVCTGNRHGTITCVEAPFKRIPWGYIDMIDTLWSVEGPTGVYERQPMSRTTMAPETARTLREAERRELHEKPIVSEMKRNFKICELQV